MDLLHEHLTLERGGISLALGVIAINSFYQPQSALCATVNIEHRTYRLLRLLPFVATVDAVTNLVLLLGWWTGYRPLTIDKLIGNGPSTETHGLKKESFSQGTMTWSRLPGWTRPSRRAILAIIAGLQLLRLTQWAGQVPFSCFCGWALFLSYIVNAISFQYLSIRPLEDVEMTLTVNDNDSPTPTKPKEDSRNVERYFIAALVLSFAFQFLHVAWMGQYLVPRRLWMDWGPMQIATTDNTNMTFAIPPGMPPPTAEQLATDKHLVIGFWPSHSFSGGLFYSINTMVMALVLTFLTMVLVMMPFMVVAYGAWFMFVFAVAWGAICLYRLVLDSAIVKLTVQAATDMNNHVNRWPRMIRVVVCGPIIGVGFILGAFAWTGVFMLPVLLMAHDYIPLDPFNILGSHAIIEYLFIMNDRPNGTYATMIGSVLGVSLIFIDRWAFLILRKTRGRIALDERRYLTAVWTVAVFSVFSTVYYCFFIKFGPVFGTEMEKKR